MEPRDRAKGILWPLTWCPRILGHYINGPIKPGEPQISNACQSTGQTIRLFLNLPDFIKRRPKQQGAPEVHSSQLFLFRKPPGTAPRQEEMMRPKENSLCLFGCPVYAQKSRFENNQLDPSEPAYKLQYLIGRSRRQRTQYVVAMSLSLVWVSHHRQGNSRPNHRLPLYESPILFHPGLPFGDLSMFTIRLEAMITGKLSLSFNYWFTYFWCWGSNPGRHTHALGNCCT